MVNASLARVHVLIGLRSILFLTTYFFKPKLIHKGLRHWNKQNLKLIFKLRIDIFAYEKPRLSFYGMKAYTEYSSFLNRGRDIFADWMPTVKTAKIWWQRKKWLSTVYQWLKTNHSSIFKEIQLNGHLFSECVTWKYVHSNVFLPSQVLIALPD